MLFTCSKEELVRGVHTVERAAVVQGDDKSLEGISLHATDNWVDFFATDGELAVKARVAALVETPGRVVMDSRVFGQIARKMAGEDVRFQLNEQGLVHLQSAQSRFTLHTIVKEAYTDMPAIEYKPFMAISSSALRQMIRKTIFATATSDSRPFLAGVYFEVEGQQIRLVATDSSRLSFHQGELINGPDAPVSAILPTRALSELMRLIGDDDEKIEFHLSAREAVFRFNGVVMNTRLIEGRFPDYERALEPTQKTKLVLGRRPLLDAVERVSLVARKSASIIELVAEEGTLTLNSREAEVGDATEYLDADHEGPAGRAFYQSRFLIDALRVIDSEQVRLELGEGLNQGRVVGTEERDYTYIVMPVRVG